MAHVLASLFWPEEPSVRLLVAAAGHFLGCDKGNFYPCVFEVLGVHPRDSGVAEAS